jgi:ABC-type transporter Mla subunit MlaD
MSKINKDNALYITHRTELLIWLLAILFLVSIFSVSFMHNSKNDENDYQVFLPDVDGLIVGSPVRMMGVQVGHVVKIKPVKDEVYVKFILTNPDVYIPQGSQITVEFSGMAGSKSLELYLPDKNTYVDKNTPIITVNPPKRLHDALNLLDDMYKKIGSIINSCSSFGGKLSEQDLSIDNGSNTNSDMNSFLKFSNKFLDDSNEKAKEIRKNLEVLKGDGK